MSTEPLIAADQLEEWRSELSALYAQMEDWIKEMEPPPSTRRQPITVTELWSGPYQVDELILTRNGRQTTARPIARDVMGADGEVDLIGTWGPYILVNDKARGGWHYVPTDWKLDLRPLTGELFRQLVDACLE
jgi:hypothetical protein